MENKTLISDALMDDILKDFDFSEENVSWHLLDADKQDVVKKNTKTKVNAFVVEKLNEGKL